MRCPPLTGLAHGGSGIALSLMELHAATGRPEMLDLAREAFAYEDRFYSAARGNWLDVRFPHSTDGEEPEGRFQVAWCHGAPGIAIARLRAAQIDTDRAEDYRTKAERASDALQKKKLELKVDQARLGEAPESDEPPRSPGVLRLREACESHDLRTLRVPRSPWCQVPPST